MKTQIEYTVEAGENYEKARAKLELITIEYLDIIRENYGYDTYALAKLTHNTWKVLRDMEEQLEGQKWTNGSGRGQAESLRALYITNERIKFLEGNPNH